MLMEDYKVWLRSLKFRKLPLGPLCQQTRPYRFPVVEYKESICSKILYFISV